MKHNYCYIIIFLIISSCSQQKTDIQGIWQLGIEKGQSEMSITSNEIEWRTGNFELIEKTNYELVESEFRSQTIKPDSDNPGANKLSFIKLDKNCMLVVNYKDYINKDMIDEVMLAKLDLKQSCRFPEIEIQNIRLPENYLGNFFIVYDELYESYSETIQIEESGIGKSSKLELLQLFNSNRNVTFSKTNKTIPILNPKQYGELNLKSINIDKYDDLGFVIIQQGINQSPREMWKEENNFAAKNNVNIEHFECITVTQLKKKYDL